MLPRLRLPLSGLAATVALAAATHAQPADARGLLIDGRLLRIEIGRPHAHEHAAAYVPAPRPAPGCYAAQRPGPPPHAAYYRGYGRGYGRSPYGGPRHGAYWGGRPPAPYGSHSHGYPHHRGGLW